MSKTVVHCFFFLALTGGIVLSDVSAFLVANPEEQQNAIISYAAKNPDIDLSTPAMIRRNGYDVDTHYVETEDHYILALHHFVGCKGSTPVLLQHGLLGSSADWVMAGKKKGLGYLLCDYGFDVWLGNFRGNTYSKGHATLSVKDSKYWNFSWHENGIYDLPAMITYITKLSNCKLFYVGHSMGTTSYYVMNILRPEIAKKVSTMFSFAPVAYMGRIKGPLRLLAPFAEDIKFIAHLLGIDEFLPQDDIIKLLATHGCDIKGLGEEACANILFAIAGYDSEQLDRDLLPVILTHTPAGASTKQVTHYAQEIMSRKFREYDYGPRLNKKMYNSSTPPDYDVSKINTSMVFYYAQNDKLTSVPDVKKLANMVSNKPIMVEISYPKFNHLDFLWAKDVHKYVYADLLRRMLKINQSSNLRGCQPSKNALKSN